MSHEILKSIRIDKKNNEVKYLQKSNNTTGTYTPGKCKIPEFLNLCSGNVFQHSHKEINKIVSTWNQYVIASGFNDIDVFFDIEFGKIDEFDMGLRLQFAKCCDLIANI